MVNFTTPILLIATYLLVQSHALGQGFRLIGTNLYDFSFAGPASRYRMRGEATRLYPQSVELSIRTGTSLQFDNSSPAAADALKYGGPEEQLRLMAAMRMGQDDKGNTRPISGGQYMTMSPAMRQYFTVVTNYAKVYLLNPPTCELGQVVDCVAVPTANKGYFDCGKLFTGNTNDFTVIYRIKNDRISIDRISPAVNTNTANRSEAIGK